jgi:pSer/pThr/pTyr-binding forkhead associated (FHA) protein
MAAAGTRVQLRLGERVVAEVAFEGAELRIGRMRENDLVINNLAVSRFHAVLRRVGDGFEIEDLGSENGTLVEGVAVRGTAAVPVGAAITVGKHTLVLRTGGEAAAQPPKPGTRPPLAQAPRSDAWDAAQTYFVAGPATRAEEEEIEAVAAEASRGDDGAPAAVEAFEEAAAPIEPAPAAQRAPSPAPQLAPVPAPELESEPAPQMAPEAAPPEPLELEPDAGALAFDEDELVGEAAPDPVAAEAADASIEPADLDVLEELSVVEPAPSLEPLRAESGGQTALFDFGLTDDLGISDRSLAQAAQGRAADPAPAPVARAPLPAPEPDAAAPPPAPMHAGLIVERLGRVEQVLPWEAPELLAGRSPDCDLVLPASGVSRRHARFVREGDAFRVLDLASANGVRVNGRKLESAALGVGDVVAIDDFTVTFVLDREPVAAMGSAPRRTAGGGGRRSTLEPAPAPVAVPERDLVLGADVEGEPIDAEKELELAEALAPERAAAEAAAGWRFEIAVATDRLPAALQRALAEVGEDELVLPAELRLVRRA